MLAKSSSDNSRSPLLQTVDSDHGAEETGQRRRWGWKKVLDVEEAKTQVKFSLPMILTNVIYFAITLVSTMFAGQLGQLELAGATLANSWATATGFAFMVSKHHFVPCVFCLWLIYLNFSDDF